MSQNASPAESMNAVDALLFARKIGETQLGVRTALDCIVRRHTAFRDFHEMTEGSPDYRPTLRAPKVEAHLRGLRAGQEVAVQATEITLLADCYDTYMAARGDARRAYRGMR